MLSKDLVSEFNDKKKKKKSILLPEPHFAVRITCVNFCKVLRKFCPVFINYAGADQMLSTRPDLE